MKHQNYHTLIVFYLLSTLYIYSQNQKLTVKDIFSGHFQEKHMQEIRSLNSGKSYLTLQINSVTKDVCIEKYDYSTQQKTENIVCASKLPKSFRLQDYQIDNTETKLLLGGNFESIYRRSYLGNYYVFNISTKSIEPLFDKKVQEPLFSPDGHKVAFVYNNNLYIKYLDKNTVQQITFDGEKNKIINGISDWVYEEEFEIVRSFQWSSDGERLAFLRFDEREVPEFSMDIYGKQLYPNQQTFKYPKAGENNSKVSIWICDVNTLKCTDITPSQAYYIPRLQWANQKQILSFQVLNRKQNELSLYTYDTDKNQLQLILKETDEAYVSLSPKIEFTGDDTFLWLSERSGWRHIYRYNLKGKLLNQVTQGNWEVTYLYGTDKNHRIYYQSTESGSIKRDVFSVSASGTRKRKLTTRSGTHQAYFSSDFSYFIDRFSNATTPNQYTLYETKTLKPLKTIIENSSIIDKLKAYTLGQKTFSTIEVNGNTLNMYMIKPYDFTPNKTYPLLMFQYSGPGSQSVSDKWLNTNDYWHLLLSQLGYIIVCVDGRGTGFLGRDFKKITQYNLGKFETADQIEAARKFSSLPYIDKNRIGIWGWSFGGFLSTSALFKGNDVFRLAIAVAPVTNWRFYDSVYTERYMGTPQENPEGYDINSPLFFSKLLKGKYLLVHGTADDNVHVQNTMRLVEALIQNDKDFQWSIYPDKDHGIYGGNTRVHLFNQMTQFIINNL